MAQVAPAFAALLVLGGQADALPRPQEAIEPRPGLVITRSATVRAGTWRLPAPSSTDSALITIRGDDITVDFRGATLVGSYAEADPDRAAGVAIRVEGGRNVRVLNARARGYKVGLLARNVRGLSLIGNDFSYNWKPRLYSLVEHESLLDWLSFHHNDRGEWLRFGAGIFLEGVTCGEIRGNRVHGGMNGLLMARTDSLRVLHNEFTFNSGLGIGLYRSTDNTLIHNTVDFNVRGYSHGFYRRGQDSAGILLYEQSSRNVVAYNTATHSGDGLFLWAGQSTMDGGAGGSNDNLFFANDFSYAPTNGMEATFSRNTFVANLVKGSEYGLWGGYSFESRVVGNHFAGNRTGVAIEHGQDNLIHGNRFEGDSTGVNLWANRIEPSDWGYPRHRDTRSRDHRISGNRLIGNRVGVRASTTLNLALTGNELYRVDTATVTREVTGLVERDTRALDSRIAADAAMPALPDEYERLRPRPEGAAAAVPVSTWRDIGREAIVVDEWGPYDFRSPKLWPLDSTRSVPLRLKVMGPPGRWSLVQRRGIASLSRTAGRVGDTLSVTPESASRGDWQVTLEYRGSATVSPRGDSLPAGRPYRFNYGRFEPEVTWSARFHAWEDSTDPASRPDAFAVLLTSVPLLARSEPRLDFMWYRPALAGLPRERWAMEATGTVNLAPGAYTLRTISDDGIRVWVDGSLVIDNWSAHESALDHARLPGGRHDLRVLYYQVGGWTELRVDILRGDPPPQAGRPRARDLGVPLAGTPGVHNAITDVSGVEVGHSTIISGSGRLIPGRGPVRTGVTAIFPRGRAGSDTAFAAWFTLNGNGEMTGTTWIEEAGFLEGPILVTNTHSVGVARDAAIEWMVRNRPGFLWALPVVAETFDGDLNDINGFHVRPEHVRAALDSAAGGRVAEGNVGGGTGMICHGFKGGIGTSSRRIEAHLGGWTVGVLVQCNYGLRRLLTIAGVPVGREIPDLAECYAGTEAPARSWLADLPPCNAPATETRDDASEGSIIIVAATDAPLLPHQLSRLAKRISLGVGRMGGLGGNSSGDIFIAFSTANRQAAVDTGLARVTMLPNERINPLFEAVVQATEEAILNAMVAAETMTGADDVRVYALPHDRLRAILARYGRGPAAR